MRIDGPRDAGYVDASGAPGWASAPNSWETLDRIERWLDEHPRASAHWRNEAHLKLGEGLVAFALEAGGRRGSSNSRLARASQWFQAVNADPESTRAQRRRAERGLATAGGGEAPDLRAPTNSVSRAQWGARPPRTSDLTRHRGRYSWITVHHSAMDGGNGTLASSADAVRRIQRDHVDNRGYGDIGYHYLIDRQGRVFEGRSMAWQGAHAGRAASGRNNNPKNVGICLLGNFDEEQPTPAALAALDRVVGEIRGHYRLPASSIKPHSFWKGTECPGRNMRPWLARQTG